jgi:hypothetical protein
MQPLQPAHPPWPLDQQTEEIFLRCLLPPVRKEKEETPLMGALTLALVLGPYG